MTLNIANLDRLISHLEGLPEAQFNMGWFIEEHECGTVACIAGHATRMFGSWVKVFGFEGSDKQHYLFTPPDFGNDRKGNKAYPLSRAIRTLKHMRSEYLRTGELVVDWDAPEPVALKEWTAPKAAERVLPEEIVSLLRVTANSEVSA